MTDQIESNQGRLTMDDPAPAQKKSARLQLAVKLAVVLTVVFALLALGLAIALGVVLSKPKQIGSAEPVVSSEAPVVSSEEPEICTTVGCAKAAGKVLEALDEMVDPCDDFYKFACGNWMRKNVIPDSTTQYTRFSELAQEVAVQLKALLEEPAAADEPTALSESRNMYQACLNEDAIEDLGFAPLTDILALLGGFPIINSTWDDAEFDYIDMLTNLVAYNNKYLLEAFVYSDYKNSTKNILQFKQQSFGLPSREYYLNSRYANEVRAYRKFMVDTAIFLNGTKAAVERDADDIIEFETYLANISQSKTETRDPIANYKKYTVAELYTNISSEFEWLRYLNIIFSKVNYTFTNDTELVVHSTQYLIHMTKKVQTTPKRTLANYLLWRFTANRISNLPKSFQSVKTNYEKVVFGVNSVPARWKKCVDYTSSFMGMAVGRMFVNKHFPEQAKVSALEMISGIRESFDELLESVTWLNDKTRKVAKEKAEAIREKIGYPEWIKNDTRINSEYEGLSLEPNAFFRNHITTLQWLSTANLNLINYDVNKNRFSADPPTVNAYYQGTENQIVFPAGILQPPFWQQDRPIALNYGSIGSVIGHEITHGFDDRGRKFDKDGNLLEWWDSDVINAFNEAKQCIVDQYGRYRVPELNRNMNGENTQGENIADNGGIKQSYQAFLSYEMKHGEGQKLPGMTKYTPKHLFFIAFAQTWCANYRDQALKVALEEGVHSLNMFRVEGSLSNFVEFSNVFKCTSGSRMNPEKKCSVW